MLGLFRMTRATEALPPLSTPAVSVVGPEGDVRRPAAAPHPPADRDLAMLREQARISARASDARTAIGWITHDASQMAD